jgi:hypothetical protein
MTLDESTLSVVPVRRLMQDGVVATRLSLADITHDAVKRMHAYWHGKCRAGRLPGRPDIDPLEFPWALGLVCLLDVRRNPLTFRYRLDGSTIAERHGADFTGRSTDEVRPDFYATMLRKHFSEVTETRRPTLYRIGIRYGGQAKTYLRLALPLAGDGATVDMIMTMSDRINPDLEDDRGVDLLR